MRKMIEVVEEVVLIALFLGAIVGALFLASPGLWG